MCAESRLCALTRKITPLLILWQIQYDASAPAVARLALWASQPAIAKTSPVVFNLTFSEPVTGSLLTFCFPSCNSSWPRAECCLATHIAAEVLLSMLNNEVLLVLQACRLRWSPRPRARQQWARSLCRRSGRWFTASACQSGESHCRAIALRVLFVLPSLCPLCALLNGYCSAVFSAVRAAWLRLRCRRPLASRIWLRTRCWPRP